MSGPALPEAVAAKAAALPRSPGVYLFKDAAGNLLYVGKAADLRARVRQYVAGGDGRAAVPHFLARTRDLGFMVTRTEAEALLLENALIKRHRPPWNVRLRDDKAYPCLRLDLRHRFPRLTVVRRFKRDGAMYFGPFADAGALRRALRALRTVYPLRSCSDASLASRKRPCLYHEIGRCNAPCVGLVGEEAYGALVREVVSLLRGDAGGLLDDLRRRMAAASEGLRFEEAARMRDRIASIEATVDRQAVAGADRVDRDAVAFRREGTAYEAGILFFRQGAVASFRHHRLPAAAEGTATDAEALTTFLAQFYERGKEVPAEVLVAGEPAGRAALEEVLSTKRGGPVAVKVPARGLARDLLRHAERNLLAALGAERPEAEADRAAEALAARLGLAAAPRRIECIDVSNLGDRDKVASRVVAEDGVIVREEARTLLIRTVAGQDDFAAMGEAVGRRLRDPGVFGPLPDLLVLDGGAGQLGAARAAAREAGAPGLPMVGLAKARRGRPGDRDKERVFVDPDRGPVVLPPGSPESLLLERVRDEAHRVAIGFHRKRRKGTSFASVLDGIPGLGPKRRMALLRAFGSSKGVAAAAEEEVAAVLGSRALAGRVLEAVRGAVRRAGGESASGSAESP
jgi:excinuclease ABC subunit C